MADIFAQSDQEEKLGLVNRISKIFKRYSPESFLDIITTERKFTSFETASIFGLSTDRNSKYTDYDRMDTELVELSSSLDLYADFMTVQQNSDLGNAYDIEFIGKSPAKASETVANLDTRTGIQNQVWFMSRNIVKYGDAFYEIVASKDRVESFKFLSPYECFINYDPKTGRKDRKIPYVQRDRQQSRLVAEFAPWEIAHFKIGEEDYGVNYSLFSTLRRTYRILRMLEDSIVVTRVVRAGSKGVYHVDVTGMSELEAARFIRRMKIINRRERLFNAQGKIRTEIDPLAGLEEVYIPIRRSTAGSTSSYQVVGGERHLGEIQDVEHFHNKLFAATKVPKAYVGYERDVNSKATLREQQMTFLRAVRRFRGGLAEGIKKIYKVEFILNGYDPNDVEWHLKFPTAADADDQVRWTIESLKAQALTGFMNLGIMLPPEWIVKKIFMNLPPAEADELYQLIKKEEKKQQDLQAQQQQQQMDMQAQAQGTPPGGNPGDPFAGLNLPPELLAQLSGEPTAGKDAGKPDDLKIPKNGKMKDKNTPAGKGEVPNNMGKGKPAQKKRIASATELDAILKWVQENMKAKEAISIAEANIKSALRGNKFEIY